MAQSAVRATQTWQPHKYLKFQQQRLRPALDLLARVSPLPAADEGAVEIVDLGAGTGNMAPAFLQWWPKAQVTFVGSTASMLEVAHHEHNENETLNTQQFTYVQADFETYNPGRPVDLIFSNAALQWAHADKHKDIMSRLYSFLKPGGVLAFQIPDTRLQPNYDLMLEAAAALGLSERVAGVRSVTCEHDPEFYFELFKAADSAVELDMWVTVYAHILEGDNPVADFRSSTSDTRPSCKWPLIALYRPPGSLAGSKDSAGSAPPSELRVAVRVWPRAAPVAAEVAAWMLLARQLQLEYDPTVCDLQTSRPLASPLLTSSPQLTPT